MKIQPIIWILIIALKAIAGQPDGNRILQRVDANLGSENKIIVGKMIIHGRRGSRTIESKSWIRGQEQSFTEYLSPAREKGTKMLKLANQLWTYSPSTDRIIRISGHMLRQSLMGSDLSYEDMMEDPRLHRIYRAQIIGEETLLERPCWILELIARTDDISYYKRKVWVDKKRFVGLKEKRYARSGRLLKTIEIKKISRQQNRWLPEHMVFKDVLKKGKGTEFIFISIEFDVDIPPYIFSKAALRK